MNQSTQTQPCRTTNPTQATSIKKVKLYPVDVVKVIDGDTVDLMARWDVFNITIGPFRTRLQGINAYESRTRDKTEKKKGLLAKEFLINLLGTNTIVYASFSGKGKFGRHIVDLFCAKNDHDDLIHINELLVKQGHAVHASY